MSVAPLNDDEWLQGLPKAETEGTQPLLARLSRLTEYSTLRNKPTGQNYSNPCCCFAFLCNGTCSLRTGCYVVGGLTIAAGLTTFLLIIAVPEEQMVANPVVGAQLMIFGSVKAHEDILGLAIFTFPVLCVVGGMSTVLAARWLSMRYACVGTTLTTIAAILVFMMAILFTRVYNSLEAGEEDSKKRKQLEDNSAIILSILWFLITLPLLIFTVYSALCAYGLYSQLSHGEYEGITPEPFCQGKKKEPPKEEQSMKAIMAPAEEAVVASAAESQAELAAASALGSLEDKSESNNKV